MPSFSPTAEANVRLLGALPSVRAAGSPDAGSPAGTQLPHADMPVATDLGNGLVVVYLVDEGGHYSYVQNRDLEASGFNREGLHECAVSNLSRNASGKAEVKPHGPIHGVFFDGMFEASLMLVEPLWDGQLAHLAPNGFVAALPSRDVFAFCDAKSAQGIAVLRDMAAKVTASGTHLLTPQLYTHRDGQWVPYTGG